MFRVSPQYSEGGVFCQVVLHDVLRATQSKGERSTELIHERQRPKTKLAYRRYVAGRIHPHQDSPPISRSGQVILMKFFVFWRTR